MQRVTLLSRKNKRLISQTDPFFRPGPDKTVIASGATDSALASINPLACRLPGLQLQLQRCCVWMSFFLAVFHHPPETVIAIKHESLSFVKRRSVCLLHVCLQEGGGVNHFSIYVAGIEHKPMLVNTVMGPTVSSQYSVFITQACC